MIAARAFQYPDDPVGATGMTVKDYRFKNGERAIWKPIPITCDIG